MAYLKTDFSPVFCDWLDVTFSPNDSPMDDIECWLAKHGGSVAFSDVSRGSVRYNYGGGSLVLESKGRFHRVSASGSVLSELRSKGLYRDYINLLGSCPHKVTRLDAAVDISSDAPPILSELMSRYPDGLFNFGRKAIKMTSVLEVRPDGLSSGSVYMGQRSKARVMARIYDKQLQMLSVKGTIIEPCTRVELTFSKDYKQTLYDALMPESIFYAHSGDILTCPAPKHDNWDSCRYGRDDWVSMPVDTSFTLDDLSRRAEFSPDLLKLAELASSFGEVGILSVQRQFERILRAKVRDVLSSRIDSDAGSSKTA